MLHLCMKLKIHKKWGIYNSQESAVAYTYVHNIKILRNPAKNTNFVEANLLIYHDSSSHKTTANKRTFLSIFLEAYNILTATVMIFHYS